MKTEEINLRDPFVFSWKGMYYMTRTKRRDLLGAGGRL